jgi:hypothetical protein
MVENMLTTITAKTGVFKKVFLNFNSLSKKTIFADQAKMPKVTKKKNKYCLLNSKAS